MRSAIAAVQDDKDFGIASPKTKSLAEELMKKVVENEENIDKFDVLQLYNKTDEGAKECLQATQYETKDVLPALWAELM